MIEQLHLAMEDNLPLRDSVFETLREAILKGLLPPGQHLMEMQLATQLGVSRTPVREAIRKLELEGLVVMIPRKGARVAAISEKNLRDVLEVRRALEELVMSLACQRMGEEQLQELKEKNESFKKSCQGEDVVEMARLDVEFHQVIYQAADNSRLLQLLNQLQNQMYRYRVEHIKTRDARMKLGEEHDRIISALEMRDEKSAMEAISVHIINQENSVLSQIRRTQERIKD